VLALSKVVENQYVINERKYKRHGQKIAKHLKKANCSCHNALKHVLAYAKCLYTA